MDLRCDAASTHIDFCICTLPVHPERSVGPVAERWASARLAVLAYLIGRDSELSTREYRKSVRVAVTWSQETSTFIAGFTRTSKIHAAIRLLGKDGIVWPALAREFWAAGSRHVRRLVSRVALRGGRTLGMDAIGQWRGESVKRVSRGRQPIDAVKQAPVVIQ